MIVDKATEILDIPAESLQTLDEIDTHSKEIIQVAQLENRLIICLDFKQLLKAGDPSSALQKLKEAI